MTHHPNIQNTLKHLTNEPGIYKMFDKSGEVIYVGKATNLKKRVSSYFLQKNHSAKTQALVAQIASIEVTVTRSEKEALLLECTLIKNLRPKYNILMRDDKSFPYLYIQQEHPYPKMQTMRLKHLPEKGHYFGPYPSAHAVYETYHLLQTIFQLRNCHDADFKRRTRPCLQYQIKRCSAPCVGFIGSDEYQKSVQDCLRFLQGKEQAIFKIFTDKMDAAVAHLAFEEAAIWRDKIKHLQQVQERQAMICLQGELDVIAIQIRHHYAGICRVSVREGKVLTTDVFFPKIPYRDWYASEDELFQEVLSDFISYYYAEHLKHIPKQIIVAQKLHDESMLRDFLREQAGFNCRFLIPTRGQKKDWLNFALNNLTKAMEAHETSWDMVSKRYQALAAFLNTEQIQRMECFDISHTQGDETVASCVVFDDQGPSKKDYRRYNITGITAGDDYAAMRQVLLKRSKFYLEHPDKLPDVVIIDGGKGQVHVAEDVLQSFIEKGLLVLGVSKGPNRKAGQEKLILAHSKVEQTLPSDDEGLHLLQHIRDEAHRFAITLHRAKRQKKGLTSSLETIDGVGRVRRKLLLQRFGGMRELRAASIEEIAKVSGIGYDLAKRIFEHLHAV